MCNADNNVSLFDEAQADVWALKGDAQNFGYASANSGDLSINQAIPLSATQIGADIHTGTNSTVSGSKANRRNLGVDNDRFAYAGTGVNKQRLLYAQNIANTENNHIKTSIQPVYINFDNIEFQPIKGLSNKIFAHVGFTWDKEHYAPFIGLGGFVEFGSNSKQEIPRGAIPCGGATFLSTCSGECFNCSISQWAVWFKLGTSFG